MEGPVIYRSVLDQRQEMRQGVGVNYICWHPR